MFNNYYTTGMSADAKKIQMRFLKMRSNVGKRAKIMSVVMTAAILITMLFATVVMAAVGSDSLEHFDKNEVYFLAGVQGNIDYTAKAVPKWIKNISDNGNIDVFIKRVDMRDTKGNVTHQRIVTLSGNVGKTDFIQNSFCGYTSENNNWIFVVFDTIDTDKNPYGEINTDEIYLKLINDYNESSVMEYSAMDSKYFIDQIKGGDDEFLKLENPEIVGDFNKVENKYWNGIYINYYTYYEEKFDNYNAAGIKLSVTGYDTSSVTVKPDINIPKAYYLEMFLCKPECVTRIGKTEYNKVSEINGKNVKLDYLYSPETLEKGKTYVVNYVLKDINESVIYRQQDYVTIQ